MSSQAHAPAPSIWPLTLALGVAIAAIGILTSWILIVAGGVLVLVALFGWIAQALGEAGP